MSARDVIADVICDWSIRNGFENDFGKSVNDHADEVVTRLRAQGWAVVPVEPTEGMRKAGENSPNTRLASHVWRAMLKAAQEDSRE